MNEHIGVLDNAIISEREIRLADGAARVSQCVRCEIGRTRTNAVYGEGRSTARVLVIGEGPGETEDKTGRPFVGRAGELLTKMLAAIELTREDVFIANTVKCRPTLVEGTRVKNRPPTQIEMDNCRPYLDEQIEILRPEIILCLGAPAAKSFLGKQFAITRDRGQWNRGPLGIPLIVTYHPAYILRQTGGALTEMKRLVWDDLKQVRERLDAPHDASASREEAGTHQQAGNVDTAGSLLNSDAPPSADSVTHSDQAAEQASLFPL